MLRTSDCATRSITGHVSPPSAIPSVAPDILRWANAATRTGRALRGVADRLLALACVPRTQFDKPGVSNLKAAEQTPVRA
jgi:hypothetical protein